MCFPQLAAAGEVLGTLAPAVKWVGEKVSKAARQFSIGRSSDAATYRFTAEEEGSALAAVEAAEDQSDDRTLFDKNRHLRSRARRRRRA